MSNTNDITTRISAIRARAEAVLNMKLSRTQEQFEHNLKVSKEFEMHARSDVSWLLEQVERLQNVVRILNEEYGPEAKQLHEQSAYIARLEERVHDLLFFEARSFGCIIGEEKEHIDAELAKLKPEGKS